MKRNASKFKKFIPVKEEQKISTFFNKINTKNLEKQECKILSEKLVETNSFHEKPLTPETTTTTNTNEKRKLECISPDVIPSTPDLNINCKRHKVKYNCKSPLKTKVEENGCGYVVSDTTSVKTSPKKSVLMTSPTKLNRTPKRALFLPENNQEMSDLEEIKENLVKGVEFLDFEDVWECENKDDLNLEQWQYCTVLEVNKDSLQNLVIKLELIDNKKQTVCVLQDLWKTTKLKPNDIVNIIATKFNKDNIQYKIDNNNGFLIFEPDLLISPTTVSASQFCKRKGILTERFRAFDSGNKIMIFGTLIHELLEYVLKNKHYKEELIEKHISSILKSKEMIQLSYRNDVPIEEIKTELLSFVPKIVSFTRKYIENNKTNVTDNKFNNLKNVGKIQCVDWDGSIASVQDIEENIWCPQLGIKGKIDVTVKIKPFDTILPLELKTGKASISLEHRGQLILYTMIMNELGYKVSSGLLLYLRDDIVKKISASHREERDLIMLRNQVAYYMVQQPQIRPNSIGSDLIAAELPEPIDHHSACSKCPYSILCSSYLSRDTSIKLSDSHPLNLVSNASLSHLEASHIDYFIHWTSLLLLEHNYEASPKQLKYIWRLPPHKREQNGKSISYLKLLNPVMEQDAVFIHVFIRADNDNVKNYLNTNKIKSSFLASNLTIGNYIVISTDNRLAVASGFIKEITETEVIVTLERNLSQRYASKVFHLDTYESQQILNFSLANIAALLEPNEKAERLRELIIDLKPCVIEEKLSKTILTVGSKILKPLNKSQQRAVLKSLTTKDYLLVKGMPGTGKTATIVALIRLLVALKKTVLITSHTHSAVDNVCLKLVNYGVDLLRLGSGNKVHPRLKSFTEAVRTAHCRTVDELKQVYDKANVVAVTCLAVAHPMFKYRTLDICIVDESTQVIQCTVMKALLSTNTFILIGDPDQLPPVVKNPIAISRGMNQSLFERLDKPEITVVLTDQYRMNQVIMNLANVVTYNGQLSCANEQVAQSVLQLKDTKSLENLYSEEKWLRNVLGTNIEDSVIGINTGPTWNLKCDKNVNSSDDLLLSEIKVAAKNVKEDEERKCCNYNEAAIVVAIVKALKQGGVPPDAIGVIAPYVSQVTLLKKLISKLTTDGAATEMVEVNTIDQYQGRDKDVILFSCTKSRDVSKPKLKTDFEILEDKRRLTVALTRAKYKLIIIGDFQTLKDYSPFTKLINSLDTSKVIHLEDEFNEFQWDQVLKHLE